jgi:hypothetical protein
MFKVLVLWEREPEPERYARHLALRSYFTEVS